MPRGRRPAGSSTESGQSEFGWRPNRIAHASPSERMASWASCPRTSAPPITPKPSPNSRVVWSSGRPPSSSSQRAGTTGRKTWFADLAERVDGLVIMGRTVSDGFGRISIEFRSSCWHDRPSSTSPAVRSDNLGAARELAEHPVVGHGRRGSPLSAIPRVLPTSVNAGWRPRRADP